MQLVACRLGFETELRSLSSKPSCLAPCQRLVLHRMAAATVILDGQQIEHSSINAQCQHLVIFAIDSNDGHRNLRDTLAAILELGDFPDRLSYYTLMAYYTLSRISQASLSQRTITYSDRKTGRLPDQTPGLWDE